MSCNNQGGCQQRCCCKNKKASYATFWQDGFITVPLNGAFSFNFSGPSSSDIILLDPTTIEVKRGGIYQVSFSVSVSVGNSGDSDYVSPRVSVYVNGSSYPNAQAGFGIYIPKVNECFPLTGDAIIHIPSHSTVQLINDGPFSQSGQISTCDNGINSATFNLVKIG